MTDSNFDDTRVDARCVMRLADYPVPTYLKAFDLEVENGRGQIIVTTDIADAMVFDNGEELVETWRRPSRAVPLRGDGRPNRPLTAFSIAISPAPIMIWVGLTTWSAGYPGLESVGESRAA